MLSLRMAMDHSSLASYFEQSIKLLNFIVPFDFLTLKSPPVAFRTTVPGVVASFGLPFLSGAGH